ncbi:hypothetical protein [Litoreibacter janthinus]|uniref:hypothetical protein n=1 Tax=Litoreibacter janthinus TaxID=670154 RepID=UPI0011140F45|nr:hypothetical protein [Litoreibacter janthinus]
MNEPAMLSGLQDMLLFDEEAGGHVRVLSLIHATRVMAMRSLGRSIRKDTGALIWATLWVCSPQPCPCLSWR